MKQEAELDNLGFEIQKQIQESARTGQVAEGLDANLKKYKTSLTELRSGLHQLDIKDSEIKALADKKAEMYALSGEGLELTVKAMSSKDQSDTYMQEFEQKLLALSNQANQVNADIRGAEMALVQKYMPPSQQPQAEAQNKAQPTN
ncbi:hypothetical protein RYD26_11800 [Pasteurellaceae bacterium LIM206]|nr:hypothetical protein [Pasteurellaceae bacterium LIM206]